jgi:hypothetical protein
MLGIGMVAAVLAAGCGQAGGAGSSPTSGGPPPAGAVSGVVVRHDSAHPAGGMPLAGVRVGLYTRAITTAGPVMLNPPRPVMTTVTDAGGAFAFTPAAARARWFVAAIGAPGYAPGRWVALGGRVTLGVCSDCPIPL